MTTIFNWPPPVLMLLVFVYGAIIGSFLNVCIFRIPLNLSVVTPRSRCGHCHAMVRAYDNIPIVSFIIIKGQCRFCGVFLSWQYPVIEFLSGMLAILLFSRFGWHPDLFISAAFLYTLLVISIIDLHHQIIPDGLSLSGIVIGILIGAAKSLIDNTSLPILSSLSGAFAGGAALFSIAWLYFRITGRDGLGGGDVKLLAMIGAYLGIKSLPFVLFFSSAIGLIAGLTYMFFSGKGMRAKIPFGPALSLGASVFLIFPVHQLPLFRFFYL